MSSTVFNPMNFITDDLRSTSNLDHMSIPTEESYFIKAMNFVIESRNEFNSASKDLYRTILESGNDQEVITEGFSDFFSKIKEIIDKFIKFIKSLFQRFITALNSAMKRDKYIQKHKKDFEKFSEKNEFTFDGYEYTFSPSIPVINALESFSKEFIEIDFSQLDSDKTADRLKNISSKVSNQYTDFINKLENDWYDVFRGRTIGMEKYPITQSEFAKELFALYRNETSDKTNITVNKAYVEDAYKRFENCGSLQNETKKTKERIEKEYNSIKSQVQQMVGRNKDMDPSKISATIQAPDGEIPTFELNNEILATLDLFVKAKVDQVQEMSAIHALAFSAKLDAISDCFRQDKAVLYKALSKIQGTISESTRFVLEDSSDEYTIDREGNHYVVLKNGDVVSREDTRHDCEEEIKRLKGEGK